MDQIWLAAPSPAMRLGRELDASGWRVNAAAQAWAAEHGLNPAELWPALAAELQAALADEAARGTLETWPLRWQALPLTPGWLVWLSPIEPAPSASWCSAADKLALVQEFAAIGVFERDLVTQEARWDAQMFKLFGLDPGHGSPRLDHTAALVHPADRERFWAEYTRSLREGGRHSVRYRIVWPDGSVHDMHSLVEVRLAADGTPRLLAGVVVDDTDAAGRVRAQQAITAHLARALHLARVSVWRVDFHSRRIHFNDAGYALIGLAPRPEGIDIDELRSWAHPDDLPELLRASDLATTGNEVIDVELRFRDPNGTYHPLLTRRVAERDEQGHLTGLLGITIDQSAQMAVRERIHTLLRRIEVVADAADLGIWSVAGEGGQVEWNAQMYRIYGIERDQLPASLSEWRDRYVHPDDRDALTEARHDAIRSGAPTLETEFRIIRPDGTLRWVTSRSRREQHGGDLVLIGIHLDTTELIMQRQRVEQALHEKELAQRASQAKSDLLARASHELRTPLNAVLGFAQLIEHDGLRAPPALQLERVAHIRTAGEHLLALVDDVLDLAAIEAGSLPVTLSAVSVDAVMAEVAQWLGVLAQRSRVRLVVQPCGGWVQADARRLRQIVANLLSNALTSSAPDATVWLGARRLDDGPASAWQISVRDASRGLSAAQAAHIFDAFHRPGAGPNGLDGIGLRLAIVQQLATLMRGHADVVSEPGQGCEFRVSLAAIDRAGPDTPPPAPAAAGSVAAGAEDAPLLRVLCIEDNPVNMILVQGLVALRPHVRLYGAVDGLSGVAVALAQRPDVVLIDMQLPDIDGFEVRRRLRAEPSLAASRLIALSANGLAEDIARAMAAGFDDYWTKPIDFKLFLTKLDELIATPRPPR